LRSVKRAPATAGRRLVLENSGRPDARTRGRVDIVAVGLILIGLELVGVSLLMIVAPDVFFRDVAPIGVQNDHYILDGATFQLSFGIGALLAARTRAWRVPVLALLTFQSVLHTLNHLKDIDNATPRWLGVANFVGLAVLVLLLGLLLRRALTERRVGAS